MSKIFIFYEGEIEDVNEISKHTQIDSAGTLKEVKAMKDFVGSNGTWIEWEHNYFNFELKNPKIRKDLK